MTKASIVERLLQEKFISTEEAVVLLTEDSNKKEVVYIPYPHTPPITYPSLPWYPTYPTICGIID